MKDKIILVLLFIWYVNLISCSLCAMNKVKTWQDLKSCINTGNLDAFIQNKEMLNTFDYNEIGSLLLVLQQYKNLLETNGKSNLREYYFCQQQKKVSIIEQELENQQKQFTTDMQYDENRDLYYFIPQRKSNGNKRSN